MPKTYTQNLGITKPAEGEEDGVWGDLVNENMDIVDRAINGSISLTLTGTSSTLTTLDGDLSNGQYKVIRLTGTPSGTHTITINPNTSQKVYFVYNTTAQSVVFTQGSGGNVTIAAGDSGVIYSSGVGATSAVVNLTDHFAMNSVNITGGSISGVATITTSTGVFGLGAVGTPSITFTGDTNTGIFSPAADTLAFVEGGVEAMRISNAGFVGIGTNAPGTLLDVNGTTRTSSLFFPSTSNQVEVRAGNTTSFHDTDFTQLTTAAAGVRFFRNTNTTGGSSVRFFRGDGTATEDARVGVGAVDSFFATASGRLGVGIVLPVNKLHVVSAPPMSVPAAGATGHALGVGAHPYGLALGVLDNGTSYLQSTRWDGTPTNYNLILQPNGGDTGIGTSTVSGIFGRTLQIGDGSTLASINLPGTGAGTTGDLILYSGASSATIAARAATDLVLATGDVERMRIDSAGNLGLGVTPSAWLSSWKALDITNGGSSLYGTAAIGGVATNAFLDSGIAWRYKISSFGAGRYEQDSSGNHTWFSAPSGTAGGAITFNASMRLDAAGNLGIGLTSPAVNLDIGGSAAPTVRTLSTTNAVDTRMVSFGGSGTAIFGTFSNHPLAFFANNGERMRITSAGFVGIGTASPAQPLHITTSGATIAAAYVQNDTGDAGYFLRSQNTGLNTIYFGDIADFQAGYIQYSHSIDTLLSRSAGPMVFQTGGSNERMRITSAGDLGVGTTAPTTFGVGYQTIQVNATNGGVFRSSNTAATAVGDFYADNAGVVILRSATNVPLTLQTNSVERFRIGTAGQLGIGGATYGTAGQVLTSGGPSAAPSWTSVAASGGTVTSVAVSGGTTGLTTSGGPITTTGTITLAGTLALTNGGTGATTDVGARSNLGLGTMATQGSSAVTITGGSITGITDLTVADGGTGASDAATARTNLGLAIGTNVQAYDAGLQSIAGLVTVADRMIYTTASDVYAVTTLTAAGRAILDDADAAAQRTTLGLAIGTNVQAWDTNLDQIAALAPTAGNFIVGNGSAWTLETPAQALASLGVTATATELNFVDGVTSAVQTQLDAKVNNASLVGEVSFFARNTAPTGWLKANGAVVSRTTYATLFAAIGTTFGVGDGSTTFGLPDLRGEFARGWDDARGVDTGRVFGSAQTDDNKSHDHTVTDPGHTHGTNARTQFSSGSTSDQLASNGSIQYPVATINSTTTGITLATSGGTEARPRNIALLACIKF